jgi:hypothetical protein
VVPAPAAGAGTYHFAVKQGLALYGIRAADGIAYATVVHGVQMIMILVLGAIFSIVVLVKHKRASNIKSQEA